MIGRNKLNLNGLTKYGLKEYRKGRKFALHINNYLSLYDRFKCLCAYLYRFVHK